MFCSSCSLPVGHTIHIYALPGFEEVDDAQEQARAEAEGLELTARLRTPKASIDARTREVEQHSPLFRDTTANTLGSGLFS